MVDYWLRHAEAYNSSSFLTVANTQMLIARETMELFVILPEHYEGRDNLKKHIKILEEYCDIRDNSLSAINNASFSFFGLKTSLRPLFNYLRSIFIKSPSG